MRCSACGGPFDAAGNCAYCEGIREAESLLYGDADREDQENRDATWQWLAEWDADDDEGEKVE